MRARGRGPRCLITPRARFTFESGELTLEDSIARYEEGVRLSRGLTAKLDEAEKRIERLVEDEGGEAPRTEPARLETDDASGETFGLCG
jgi:exodeoxyribonuclease VII small subunit